MQLGPWSYSAVHVLIHLINQSNQSFDLMQRSMIQSDRCSLWTWTQGGATELKITTTHRPAIPATCTDVATVSSVLSEPDQILRKCLFCGGNSPWQLSGLTRWWTSVLVLSLFAPRWRLHSAALPPSSCFHRSARSAASPALEGWRGRWALCLPRLGRTSPLWSWASRTGPI